MKTFLGILTICLLALVYSEKDDCKRKHLTWGFIALISALTLVNIATLIL